MKTALPRANTFIKCLCIFLFSILIQGTVFSQANPRITSVTPESNLATVTITNFGDAAVDLSDYWLCLRPGTYRQLSALNPVGDVNVMPSGTVTVSYNVTVGVASDGLSMYLPETTTTGGGFGVAANMIDFVQWGAAGNIREPLAVTQGLWTMGDFIVGSGPYTYTGDGTQNGLSFWSACDVDGGTLTGGPFEFVVDGTPDNLAADDITLTGNVGSESQWVITDDAGVILGLPPSFTVPDFDEAGPGICYVWHLSHDGSLTGAAMGANAMTDLGGCFSLSNFVKVERKTVSGGTLTGGPFTFCVDGTPDNLAADDITLTGNVGSESQWVITDDAGVILGLPPSFTVPDFDTAGPGICYVWHLSHDGSLTGAAMGANAMTDLGGNFDLSNFITVVRNQPDGAAIQITGTTDTEVSICVGEGTDDLINAEVVGTGVGANNGWVITDNVTGEILGLPPGPPFNLEGAGDGVCAIWYIRYEDGLTGLTVNANVSGLSGCFDLSNPILVTRLTGTDCDVLSISEFDRELAISVFPVPASTELSIKVNDVLTNRVDVQLFNMLGQEIKTISDVKTTGNISLNVSDVGSGMYMLYVIDQVENSASVRQVVIE